MSQTYVFAPDIAGSSGVFGGNTPQSYGEWNCSLPNINPFAVKNTSNCVQMSSASGLYQKYNRRWNYPNFYSA